MALETKNLGFYYEKNRWIFKDINLSLESKTITVLLGDSGLGKSTLAKIFAGYEKPTEGSVALDGADYLKRKAYCPVQLIQQHPEKAINPRFKMRDVLHEGYEHDKSLLDDLGIEDSWLKRYPLELSGGELQRFCIARSLGPMTQFIIADEISAMLDPVTQAQIWTTLVEESVKRGIGILAITHDIDLAEKLGGRRLVMTRDDKKLITIAA
jgi:peptide/nickel transport system ATP-binding protein